MFWAQDVQERWCCGGGWCGTCRARGGGGGGVVSEGVCPGSFSLTFALHFCFVPVSHSGRGGGGGLNEPPLPGVATDGPPCLACLIASDIEGGLMPPPPPPRETGPRCSGGDLRL